MSEVISSWKIVVVLVGLVSLIVLERIYNKDHWPQSDGRRKRLLNNGGLWVVNAVLSPLVVIPLTALVSGHALSWRPDWWVGIWGLVLDLLLLDIAIYGWHVANHRIAFLWRFHRVHHLDEFLDVTSALRFHFGEVLLSALARAAFIFAVGIPLSSVLVFETLVLLATAFHHSNLRLPPRLEQLLSRVIVTPSIHWVHHHAVSSHTDSNYATILSCWDPVFRTRSTWQRQQGMKIGVANESERTYLKLLTLPFRR